MTKKRKLNSKNPKYWSKDKVEGPKIKKRVLSSQGPNKNTNVKFKCEGIWFENN